MKKILNIDRISLVTLVLFSTLYLGCSESGQTNVVEIPIVEPLVIIQYDSSNDYFVTKEIKYSELVGKWKLLNAKYKCALGELEHIENFYEFTKDEKQFIFGESTAGKIYFWNKPEYNTGVLERGLEENVKEFNMTPSNGGPPLFIQINYTDEILTLHYYSEMLLIDGKYYEGIVTEIYEK